MMKNLKLFLMLTLISAFVFISCDNDVNNDFPYTENPESENSINYDFGNDASRSFMGEIVDSNNNPIQGVDISIGNTTAITDENGVFIINDATVKEKFAYIKTEKVGYLNGFRAVVPTQGVNQVKIMLLDATSVATINSGTASSVTLPNDTKVEFSGNFKKEDGSTYTGTVDVVLHHLDSSDPNIEDKMPGMLFASNENNEARVLETFGMINVELLGSSGEKLQIADDATIKMPIDNAQLGTAPNTIPLWHFDEEKGYWVEEGSATKSGNFYVGTVSHFSWWNCDVPFPVVNLCLTVVNENDEPLSNITVELIPEGQTYGRIGRSDNNGDIYGMIPKDKTLTMNVKDLCYNTIYTTTIGPFSSPTTLNTELTNASVSLNKIEGILAKCDNTNVTNGYVVLKNGGRVLLSSVTNGDFSFNTINCSGLESFILEGYDYDNVETSGEVNYTFSNTLVTNTGVLVTCSAVSEYITYKIDNNPTQFLLANISASATISPPNPNYPNTGTTERLRVQGNDGNLNFSLFNNSVNTGVYDLSTVSVQCTDFNLSTSDNVTFTISQVDTNGYIDISFSGTYQDSTNPSVTHTVIGVIHALHD